MKKRITPAQRRHQDYLRKKGLAVGKTYMTRLAKLRHGEVKRVLELCKNYNDLSQWRGLIESNINESPYLYDWYKGLYLNAGLPHASSVVRDLSRSKAEGPGGAWEQAIVDYATRRAGHNILIVSGTLRDDLIKLLDEEINNDINIGIEKLAKNILKGYDEKLNLWQCRRIAQTETMISLAEAGAVAAESLDVRFTKEWCISGVGNTRESHEAMDGVVVDENEYFLLEGNTLMLYPHDTSMNPPAGEIINCACSVIRMPK